MTLEIEMTPELEQELQQAAEKAGVTLLCLYRSHAAAKPQTNSLPARKRGRIASKN